MLGTSYRDLENQLLAAIVGRQGVENGRELFRVELDCNWLSASLFEMRGPMARAELHSRDAGKVFRIPSTTAPMT